MHAEWLLCKIIEFLGKRARNFIDFLPVYLIRLERKLRRSVYWVENITIFSYSRSNKIQCCVSLAIHHYFLLSIHRMRYAVSPESTGVRLEKSFPITLLILAESKVRNPLGNRKCENLSVLRSWEHVKCSKTFHSRARKAALTMFAVCCLALSWSRITLSCLLGLLSWRVGFPWFKWTLPSLQFCAKIDR